MRNGLGFASSGSRNDKKWAFRMQGGFLLPLVEVAKIVHCKTIAPPRCVTWLRRILWLN